jgi:predicted DsbA family dithiol-disulfide isomerase
MSEPIKVDVWSDIACPWCYIGKRRFEAALAQFPHADQVEVRWRSYELDPAAPRRGAGSRQPGTLTDRLAAKMGVSTAQVEQMNAQITALAREVGLDYHLDRAIPANTFDAHRLLHWAFEQGRQAELEERLFHAYFTEGLDVADHAVLAQLAGEVGLDPTAAGEVLGDANRYADAVRADIALAGQFGATGVPFYVLDRRFGVSGAQPTELFTQALTQAWEAETGAASAPTAGR